MFFVLPKRNTGAHHNPDTNSMKHLFILVVMIFLKKAYFDKRKIAIPHLFILELLRLSTTSRNSQLNKLKLVILVEGNEVNLSLDARFSP